VNYKTNYFRLPCFEMSFNFRIVEKYDYTATVKKFIPITNRVKGSIQGDEFSAIKQNRKYTNYFTNGTLDFRKVA
jgi:iron complex outermembrane receptor protein